MKRQLVVRSSDKALDRKYPRVTQFEMMGTECVFGWSDAPSVPADLESDELVVEVTAFSVNYRDRAHTWDKALRLNAAAGASWAPFGSEFCGTVVALGGEESNHLLGKRVIGRNDFDPDGTFPQGVTTNGASRRYLTLKATRVAEIPEALSEAEACTFGLAAQTAASMVRRGQVKEGARVLVTGGNSHTSRFIAQMALYAGAEVTILSRGESKWPYIHEIGQWQDLASFMERVPGRDTRFDAVLDPFIDVYAGVAMPFLKADGIYVTCGFANQIPSPGNESLLRDVIIPAMVRCARIEVNAIGKREDLDRALRALSEGALKCPTPQEYTEESADQFLRESFGIEPAAHRPVLRYANTES